MLPDRRPTGKQIGKSLRAPVEAQVKLVSMLDEEVRRVAALNSEHKATREDLLKSIRREKSDAER